VHDEGKLVAVSTIATYAKALVGFLVPAAVVITSSVQEGSDGGSAITTAEWITAACAAVITGGGVWAVKNRAPAEPVVPGDGAETGG